MSMLQSPIITFTPALGSTTSPYAGLVNITQRLCFASCADNTPVFDPRFSVRGVSQVGTNLYAVDIHVEGQISYVACGGGCGCCKQQPLSDDFYVYVQATSFPTVTLTEGASINRLSVAGCQTCGRTFVSDTPLTLTVTTA